MRGERVCPRRAEGSASHVAQFLPLCSASHLAEAGRIACKDARLFEPFSCLWTPSSTFYKLLEIERLSHINALASEEGRMSSLWHVFCSLLSVETCVEHVGYREAVTSWSRYVWPVDLTHCSHHTSMRRNPMATEARETVDLIGSDKVEGT